MFEITLKYSNGKTRESRTLVPRSLAPIKKDHLRPKSTVYTSTNNHLGLELGGTGVLGVGTGDRGLRLGDVGVVVWGGLGFRGGERQQDLDLEMFYNEQTTIRGTSDLNPRAQATP